LHPQGWSRDGEPEATAEASVLFAVRSNASAALAALLAAGAPLPATAVSEAVETGAVAALDTLLRAGAAAHRGTVRAVLKRQRRREPHTRAVRLRDVQSGAGMFNAVS
jgi:hypothetical protein